MLIRSKLAVTMVASIAILLPASASAAQPLGAITEFSVGLQAGSSEDEQVDAITISFIRCPGAPYCGHLARVVAFGRRMGGSLARS
jgi:hypothetical protein